MMAWLSRHRYASLLGALVLCLILSPIAEIGWAAGLFVASGRRSHLLLTLMLAVPVFVLDLSGATSPETELSGGLVLMLLLVFVMGLILRDLVSVRETDFDMIFGAIALYLLIGVTWALSYGVIERLWPGSYGGDPSTGPVWSELLYFSLTTLTTLGYGDLAPGHPAAGIWATMEAVCGSLYVAVLVARVVSLIRR